MGSDTTTSSNWRPGEPLRRWGDEDDFAEIDLRLLLKATMSARALLRLIRGEKLGDADVIALARLNSLSVSQWREPPTFIHKSGIFVDPDAAALFESLHAAMPVDDE